MTLLADKNIGDAGANMVISGFILGTVIFVFFLWSAIQSFKGVKQIKKFKEKNAQYYEDKYAAFVIYLVEALTLTFYVAELITFIVAAVFMGKYWKADANTIPNYVGAIDIATDVLFLCVVILVISYMVISSLWMASLIVVVDQDTLITTNAIAPRSAITVSRVLKSPHVFKITYKDQEIKGNLKDTKLRYSEGMKAFLIDNRFYAGDNND